MRAGFIAAASFLGASSVFAGTPINPPLAGATAGQWLYPSLSDGFRYDVLLPYQYSSKYTYPVVLYLHGLSTEAPPNQPPNNAFPAFINSTNVQGVNYRAYYPAIVVAPQCAGSAFGTNDWGGTRTTYLNHQLVNPDMPCGDDAITALKTVMASYSVNPAKIYIAGYSMGGFGVYYRYATNLNLFAAAVPVSGSIYGGVTENTFENILLKAPLWAFHGFNDQTVPKTWDEHMYSRSQKKHGLMQYIEFVVTGDKTRFPNWLENADGDGHANADISAFQSTLTMNWLFAQSHP